jgi:murein L,D-transpeptidase YcbB/YkuD
MAFNVGSVGQELRTNLIAGDTGKQTIADLLDNTLNGVAGAAHESSAEVQADLNEFVKQFGALLSDAQYKDLGDAIEAAFMDTGIELDLPARDDMSRLTQYGELSQVFQGNAVLRQGPLHAEPYSRAVELLQKAMQRISQDGQMPMVRDGADGRFGPETKTAVVSFQKTFGLTPDGVVGKNTLTALNAALKLVR